MADSRLIRFIITVPENAPITTALPPVSKSLIASSEYALSADEALGGSLPATTDAFKIVKAGLKFSAEIETLDIGQTLSEVVMTTNELAKELKAKGEDSWTADHMLELQKRFTGWQNKRLRHYKVHELKIPDAVDHGDLQHEPGPADTKRGEPSQFPDAETSAGLQIHVKTLRPWGRSTDQAAIESDDATAAEPRESREDFSLAARVGNQYTSSLDKELKPLRDAINRDIPNFPINGRAIANLSSQQCDDLMKAFDLRSNASDVWTQQKICQYIGASSLTQEIMLLDDENNARRHAIRW